MRRRSAATQLFTIRSAASPVDLRDGGDLDESVGQADGRPLLRGVTYRASRFPLAIRLRPPDGLWEGVQVHSGRFTFVSLLHKRVGDVPLNGRGVMTLEAGRGPTRSVAATIQSLHSTRGLTAGPITPVRLAGFSGKSFDATIVGAESGDPGIALAPFTRNVHCGWCNVTLRGETRDYKFAGTGQLFRIMVIGVRGKTVVIYLESMYDESANRRYPPAKVFPTFLPFAQRLLSTLAFPRLATAVF